MKAQRRRFIALSARGPTSAAAAACVAALPLAHTQTQPARNGFNLTGALVPLQAIDRRHFVERRR